jgi:hypothetical protein
MFGISSVKLQRLMTIFSPLPPPELLLPELLLPELELPLPELLLPELLLPELFPPHAARMDSTITMARATERMRFIFFLPCDLMIEIRLQWM